MINKSLPIIASAAFMYAAGAGIFSGIRLLVSRTFLSFHQQAVGIQWNEIPERTRVLILALMRVGGMGALVIGVDAFVISFPYFFGINHHLALILSLCVVAYWCAIFSITYSVHRKTNAGTPFRSSFSVFFISLIGIIMLAL